MFAYNTAVHEVAEFTPCDSIFGSAARVPTSFSSVDHLETYGTYSHDAKESSKEKNDLKTRAVSAEATDLIYVR